MIEKRVQWVSGPVSMRGGSDTCEGDGSGGDQRAAANPRVRTYVRACMSHAPSIANVNADARRCDHNRPRPHTDMPAVAWGTPTQSDQWRGSRPVIDHT